MQATLRIVKAPNPWHCDRCGKDIPATSECAKQASRILCLECLMEGLLPAKVEPIRPPAHLAAIEPPPPAIIEPLDIPHLRYVYGIKDYLEPLCGWEWLQYHNHPQNIEYYIEISAHGVHSTMMLKAEGLQLFGQIAKALLHKERKRKKREGSAQ